jgi:hypothetical protein
MHIMEEMKQGQCHILAGYSGCAYEVDALVLPYCMLIPMLHCLRKDLQDDYQLMNLN